MNIYLGDLTIEQIEKRSGVPFPDELKEFMKESYQASASNIAKGKWHCFDIPFVLVCGDMETAQRIYDFLKDQSGNFKERLQISLQQQGE